MITVKTEYYYWHYLIGGGGKYAEFRVFFKFFTNVGSNYFLYRCKDPFQVRKTLGSKD